MATRRTNRIELDARTSIDGVTTFFEVKHRAHAVVVLKKAILDLAYSLTEDPAAQAFLLLVDSRITQDRLKAEWKKLSRALRPEVSRRLGILTYGEGGWESPVGQLDPGLREFLDEAVDVAESSGIELPRPDYSFEILKVLLLHWLRDEGPLTSLRLTRIVGCSYPTAAKVLDELAPFVTRQSDRRVELSRFPTQAWNRALASADASRSTFRFVDRSGQPRSPNALIERLHRLDRSDLGVGGVPGARRRYAGFDVAGIPRLDVSVHCPGKRLDLGFVQRIDPALGPADDDEQNVALAVHVVRRKQHLFDRDEETTWADPVECLLDLHEMRLDEPAAQWVAARAQWRR